MAKEKCNRTLGTKQRGFAARRLWEVFKALPATSTSADEATIPPASSDAWGSFYEIQFAPSLVRIVAAERRAASRRYCLLRNFYFRNASDSRRHAPRPWHTEPAIKVQVFE